MIACIHTHVESIGSESQPQRISMDIGRHMELTIMQAGKNFKSNRKQRILGCSDSILKYFVKTQDQLGLNESRLSDFFVVRKEAAM